MLTFLIGLMILFAGALLYGKFCEKSFGPDDRKTPAIAKQDGVDYVPMPKWKNCLIQLLNIAGTGPILGPIQGILFGPIAFLLIPVGCVFGGALHDYFSGMISIREGGMQMPGLVKKYLGKTAFGFYNAFLCLLLLLVVAVFVTTPGDLIATQLLNIGDVTIHNPVIWIIYGVIFFYYIIATLFPIDKIIGKIYPIFGGVLLISAIGIFIGLFAKGYSLTNLSISNWKGIYPDGTPILPVFFVTVACGIVSGFHSTQSTLIGRSVQNEKEGRTTFYNMMILEGFIAMIWAAAAMGAMNLYKAANGLTPVGMVGFVAKDMLGKIGGMIAIIGVIVLPISTGDTALRSLRLIVADFLKFDQSRKKNRLALCLALSALVIVILLFSKLNATGFNILWRYFSWSNQAISIFAFAIITVYLFKAKKPFIIALIPGAFYSFIIATYIINAKIGFGLPLKASYILGIIFALIYCILVLFTAGKKAKE
ncbi:carbon starvation CstA family protein [[Clostridium] polysaccharolyticum]|uniref:Carbon starvation protein CstA n=1 Tax=[Clostridium] polysaccharolyticum TaxID=29364 RepID=A0A1I0FYG5_9FIRM|nr:carbon starvation CstA family protein [[Clostridium] polysaccharolyticum]SET62739.1 Carbon starvation protein CstA [[Clostridium] polysaccharolyticum]